MPEDLARRCWAIVPAAGSGTRMGSDTPKQYLPIDGKPILAYTLEKLLAVPDIKGVVVALGPDDAHWPTLALASHPNVHTVIGGAERADSVLQALQALQLFAGPDDWVLVHDAARPCVRVTDIERLLHKVRASDAAGGLLATPVNDTIKQVNDGWVSRTLDRSQLWAAQTPQCFRCQDLARALREVKASGIAVTDETSAMEHGGASAIVVEGRADNIKVTRQEDLVLAQAILRHQREE
ncbi:2-C-methyl-D-erythritol 4-phosphate cytidylyltransferase [uncultured Gilvimarinus sp.]|uniref:2-C-methyl-D-erythritol 4-phosphate cytidylyltransferase n=1 Tax=uncultured Gilvimarinus sp. TaxID=1689143 RepID=UPI0030EEC740